MKYLYFIIISFLMLTANAYEALAQENYIISGKITDAANGESIISGTILIKELGTGSSTNTYGFYSLKVPRGSYEVEYRYVGYEKVTKNVVLDRDITLNIELTESSEKLEEVVVVGREESASDIKSIEMSSHTMDIKTIQKLPALLGEVDVVKSLQFLPGVSQAGEGSSGFNVRGGSVGQNLILLDEAPIYNSSHMLGFFSVFNPDVVKEVKLYKGAIPAEHGGRVSSVLDVKLKEGNQKEMEVDGGVGFIFSRLALQGPIVKDKSSFIVAARRSYIDALASIFTDDFGLNFYDVTAKANYEVNEKNHLYLSAYFGQDNFGFNDDGGFNWGSGTGTLRWNKIISNNLFANISGVVSNYNYQLEFEEDDYNSYSWNSSITNYVLKPSFTYFINENSEISFGAEGTYYIFNPSTTVGVTNGVRIDNSLENKYATEMAGYISHRISFTPQIEVEYGLRLSNFKNIGPGIAYTYNDTIPGSRRSPTGEKYYEGRETIASYTNPEPRISAKFEIDEQSSIKTSYNRSSQYVHYISNTLASNPLNIWSPSTNNLKPVIGDQFTMGYFREIEFGDKHTFSASVEGFYRNTKNEVDYINGAELLSNPYLEGDLLIGNGRAYGLEFYLQKKSGAFTGWISYTLSRSELKVDGINNGSWYPTNFDQTHNLKLVGAYTINDRWSATADFAFSTGTPTTFPNQRYTSQGVLIAYNSSNSRNNLRLSPFHRLDLSLRLEGKKYKRNGKERKINDYWVFSIYNVYARKNTFSTYFVQSDGRTATGQPIQSEAHRVSIIGTMVPSVSYNFHF